ncbi:hypothetical protein BU26DRAFT_589550 [Trematosphaeria pertusa]|uniref:Uncharacterized protein n=1 Tax=Trematosphaeria pertusa TaxID=390896 RepID=A0A6A6HR16_9PLEO|nr:uncharacterized protein BU26DRAFT_589550 [Trematosphaeria pertusa]KAF2240319.1 hypothetical protein BU26DRAFT_589550 [Trematosphaeria pertusa]
MTGVAHFAGAGRILLAHYSCIRARNHALGVGMPPFVKRLGLAARCTGTFPLPAVSSAAGRRARGSGPSPAAAVAATFVRSPSRPNATPRGQLLLCVSRNDGRPAVAGMRNLGDYGCARPLSASSMGDGCTTCGEASHMMNGLTWEWARKC